MKQDITITDMFGGCVISFNSERVREFAARRFGGFCCTRTWSITVVRSDASAMLKVFRRAGLTVKVLR